MTKRIRRVVAKPGELRIGWGKEPHESADLIYAWGGGGAKSGDSIMLMQALSFGSGSAMAERSLTKELEHRGYDLTTLKFSIQKKVLA